MYRRFNVCAHSFFSSSPQIDEIISIFTKYYAKKILQLSIPASFIFIYI